MRAYIVYSAGLGPEEGALLCFANTAKEAKKLSWSYHCCWCDGWLDHTVRWLRDEHVFSLGNQELIAAGTPHVIDNPIGCESCGLWGYEVHEGGICSYCGEPVGSRLLDVYYAEQRRKSYALLSKHLPITKEMIDSSYAAYAKLLNERDPVEFEKEYLGNFTIVDDK